MAMESLPQQPQLATQALVRPFDSTTERSITQNRIINCNGGSSLCIKHKGHLLRECSKFPVECDGACLALAKISIRPVRMPSAQAPQRKGCPYSILGLPEGASIEEIKKAYHDLSRANHPDRIRGAGLSQDIVEFANQNMIRINAAYAQLAKDAGLQAA